MFKVKNQYLVSCVLAGLMMGCASSNEPSTEPAHTLVQTDSTDFLKDAPLTPSSDWRLVWSDEFDGEEIDESKWDFEENCWGGGNNELQCYVKRKSNAFIEDGVLNIVAKRGRTTGADNPNGDLTKTRSLPYSSTRLRTMNKGDWKYGRFEIRAKMPEGQGTWPAIWMLPTDYVYGGWASSGEIDIVEAVNLKTKSDEKGAVGVPEARIHGTLHYGNTWPNNVHSGAGVKLPGGVNPADDFHTYAIEWEEGEIRWYVDNIHYATQTADGWYSQYLEDGKTVTGEHGAPFNQRFHLIMNLAVGGNWAGNANEKRVDPGAFPQTLAVDYVRVYECSVNPETGKGCAVRDENVTPLKGKQAPKVLPSNDDYLDAKIVELFNGRFNDSVAPEVYDPYGSIGFTQVETETGKTVLQIDKTDSNGNFYLRSPQSNISKWMKGKLKFDARVLNASDAAQVMVKLDSGWPNTSDYTVALNGDGQWQSVELSISEIIANGNTYSAGNQANPSQINNILVIEPLSAMSVQFDNIRFE